MTAMLFLTVILCVTSHASSMSPLPQLKSDYPVGDASWCINRAKNNDISLSRLEVLPGIGWDNLRNKGAGMVAAYNFTKCKVTNNGRQLIPDSVFTIPLKTSQVNTLAVIIDSWKNTSSMTSHSINVGAGGRYKGFAASGSFSPEFESLKANQVKDKSVTVRVELRHKRYEVKLQPDFQLSPGFKRRLLNIAANIYMDNMEQARYNAQLLIRDYGTHYLTSVTAGAALIKDDYLKETYLASNNEARTMIKATATANYLFLFEISASYGFKTDSQNTQNYKDQLTKSDIWTLGGPLLSASKTSIDKWQADVEMNLVSIDKAGEPLSFLVTQEILPGLPVRIVAQLEKIVREAILQYYEMNTIKGCTEQGSPNFSFSANFDDGSCYKKAINITFGGVYQTCMTSGVYKTVVPCKDLSQVNPKTGDFSCPGGFKAVLLATGTQRSSEYERRCRKCGWWGGRRCCDNHILSSKDTYNAYWCAASGSSPPQESGYLFGGLYTNMLENAVTKEHSCPTNYQAMRLLTDLHVCVSDSFDLAAGVSVPIGGFFSCKYGNPLVEGVQQKTQKKRCPVGYSQRLAVTHLGCNVYYCIETGYLPGPLNPPVKRPPYLDRPPLAPVMMDDDNMTKAMAFMNNEISGVFRDMVMTKVAASTQEEVEEVEEVGNDGASPTALLSLLAFMSVAYWSVLPA